MSLTLSEAKARRSYFVSQLSSKLSSKIDNIIVNKLDSLEAGETVSSLQILDDEDLISNLTNSGIREESFEYLERDYKSTGWNLSIIYKKIEIKFQISLDVNRKAV